jgi:hypothetical protein
MEQDESPSETAPKPGKNLPLLHLISTIFNSERNKGDFDLFPIFVGAYTAHTQ